MKLLAYFLTLSILSLPASFAGHFDWAWGKVVQDDFKSSGIAENWKYESLKNDFGSCGPNDGLLLRFYGPAPAWSEGDMEGIQPSSVPEQNGSLTEG